MNRMALDKALTVHATTTIAMDRESVRGKDVEGRLKVAMTNISKADVNPYYGREIPFSEELGLEPDKIYQLLRPPEELEKAASTANEIQLLKKHIPVSAEDHRPYDVVGTTGSHANYEHPFLRNSLTVWAQDAIDEIESEEKREISMGYHYVPVMEPGVYDGKAYDGKMTQLVFNHCALVETGRAGEDVCVGDEGINFDAEWDLIESALRRFGKRP
jgi:hypothetical protein